MALVEKVSPTLVTSDIGVPDAIAPGIGNPSSFTFNPISSTSAPPAEVPKKAMFFAGGFEQSLVDRDAVIQRGREIGLGRHAIRDRDHLDVAKPAMNSASGSLVSPGLRT